MDHGFRREMLLSIGLILASFVASGVAGYLFSGDLAKHAERIVADRAQVNQRLHAVETFAQLKQIGVKLQDYEKKIGEFLPSQDNLLGLPRQVQNLGKEKGIDARFAFSGEAVPSGDANAGSLGFTLQASGEYRTLKSFLSDIETRGTGYLINLTSLILRDNGNGYSANATGKIYFK